MFDRIVKKIFLTKEARDSLEARNRQAGKPSGPPSAANLDAELARAAKDAGEAEAQGALRDDANATDLDRETIREAIASAHRELVEEGGGAGPAGRPVAVSAAPPEANHEELVKSAMLIYRQKQKVLADLDPTARKKLRLMARTIFGAQMKK